MYQRYSYLLIFILIISLVLNIVLIMLAKKLYVAENALRLDPLQLSLYPSLAPPKTKTRVVFFGDSRALSWPSPNLEQIEFINRGIGQQTSAQIELRFEQHVKPLQADWVIVQLCVNDLKAIPLLPDKRDLIIQQCKTNLQQIVDQATQQGSKVLLTTIFPLGEVPLERRPFWSDEVADAIDTVNTFIKTLQGDKVRVLDTYQLLVSDTPQLIRKEYSRDLLHLNSVGYEQLNQALIAFIEEQR